MTRPRVPVLTTLLISIFLLHADGRAQTLLPLIVDDSGNFQIVAAALDPPENLDPQVAEEETPKDTEGKDAEAAPEETQPEKPAPAPLSPDMAAFRDQVRRALSGIYSRSVSTQSNVPAEVIAFCEAFGHKAEIASGGRSREMLNGVGAVCWSYPCSGYTLLRTDGSHTVARVGYGYQDRPAQLLAMLARNRIPVTYEVRIGEHHGTIADLVESEKLGCRTGLEQSGTLTGLAYYTGPGETWENDLGETWSVERLLREELDRDPETNRIDVIHRLMGINDAVRQRKLEDGSDEKLWKRAEDYLKESHDYALKLQNEDGTWHPGFFAYRGTSKDSAGTLLSTGAILAWLVDSLPENRLDDPRLVRGLGYLYKQLATGVSRRSASPSSSQDVMGQLNAARALALYDARYFTPRTPKEPPSPEDSEKSTVPE